MVEQVKLLLGIEGSDKDELIQFLVDDCTQRALAYCRRDDIPDGMRLIIPISYSSLTE